ncbi:MAG: hypothetical protein ACXAC7_23520 [Candidatus Hodarchaeales archaeon]
MNSLPQAEIIKESQRWVIENKGLKIVKGEYCSPRVSSELPDCSMPMTFDHLSFCSLGCVYCFAYFFKSNNPTIKDIGLKSVNTKKLISAIQGKPKSKRDELFYKHFYSKKFLFHWGGLADPFCNFEKNNWKGYDLIEFLGSYNYPTLFSFKGDAIFHKKYIELFERHRQQKNFAFQVSIITRDDDLAKQIEIGVPTPSKRIGAINMLSDMGYWTILRLRPFIIGISDLHLDKLLDDSLKAGIRGVSLEFFALDARSNLGMKTRYEHIAKIIGVNNLQKYFARLSPHERGGYMRLNRLVKETHVKKIYKFCIDNDLVFACSDPDFKELNTSGSCCGMPDNYPDNRLLENWTRSQLTYHFKECRKQYHKTGNRILLEFNDVYGNESYLDDKKLSNDHVSVIGQCSADRTNLTLRYILQEKWNNLRSPANPRNYLHGKLMPCGLDDAGNLKYIYTPSEYEQRWKDEGVDLTK